MNSIKELSRSVAVLRALQDMVKIQLDEIKAITLDELGGLGVERVAAALPDGTVVAHVTRVVPKVEMRVIDDEAAVEWARRDYPDLVEHVPEKVEVIPAHDRLAIGAAEELIAMVALDGEAIPGIGIAPAKNEYLMVKFAPNGQRQIAEGLRQQWLIDSVVQGLLGTGEGE